MGPNGLPAGAEAPSTPSRDGARNHIRDLLDQAIRQRAAGDAPEAIRAFRSILSLDPASIPALVGLGEIARESGRPADAAGYYRRAIALGVEQPGLYNNLGLALRAAGKAQEAIPAFRNAATLAPGDPMPLVNLGDALTAVGDVEGAEAALLAALKLDPGLAAAHLNLGNVRRRRDRLSDAAHSYRTAAALAPDNPRAHGNLGLALAEAGRIGEAISALRQAVALDPDDPVAASNLCYALCYDATQPPESVLREHRRWNAQFGPPGARAAAGALRGPERSLRIGYVSPDFRSHPVGAMVSGLLAHRDRSRHQAICYSAVDRPDAVTARLRSHADTWRETAGLTDQALAEQVRADGIDILVDLSGHMAGGRLAMFSQRPASLQVAWAGYPFSTGSDAIDAVIVDRAVAPDGAERLFAERVVRLPRVWTSYSPPASLPAVAPAMPRDHILFGSFNNPQKIDGSTIRLWARLVQSAGRARILLKAPAFEDAAVREHFARQFAAEGLQSDRLAFAGASAWEEHLAAAGGVDIALDPLPYTGATTTIECLLMGTPVVTRAGAAYYQRHAVGILGDVGLSDLVAGDAADYLDRALNLAGDGARRVVLRRELRARMLASPVCDGAEFARAFEDALRGLWRDGCATAC